MDNFKKTLELFLAEKGHTMQSYLKLSSQQNKPIRQILVWAGMCYYDIKDAEIRTLLNCKRYNTIYDPKDIKRHLHEGNAEVNADVDLFIRIDETLHGRKKSSRKRVKDHHTFTVSYLDQMESITTPEERSLAYKGIMEALRWGDKIRKENTLRMIQLHKIRKSWE